MSKQNNRRDFRPAPAAKLPTLVCTGYIAKIGEGKEASSGRYNINRIDINGYGGSRNVTINLLTRPEWFASEPDEDGVNRATFQPASLDEVEGGKSIQFVYRKNIKAGEGDSASVLQGLSVTEDRFYDLVGELLDAEGIAGENSPEVLTGVLRRVLTPEGEEPVEVGYILKQKRTKTDDLDENGKNIYILENAYEVDDFWEPTEENKKKYLKSAERSAEKAKERGEKPLFKVAYEATGSPF